jgi:hypothetical protein
MSRPTFAGAHSSTGNYKSTTDPGKAMASGSGVGGYRSVSSASGPQSSISNYASTLDPGKNLPSGQTAGGYRRVNNASGPQSSTANYISSLDPGVAQSVSGGPGSGHNYFSSSSGFTDASSIPKNDE